MVCVRRDNDATGFDRSRNGAELCVRRNGRQHFAGVLNGVCMQGNQSDRARALNGLCSQGLVEGSEWHVCAGSYARQNSFVKLSKGAE